MKNLATHAIIFLVLLAAIKSFAQTSENSLKDQKALDGGRLIVDLPVNRLDPGQTVSRTFVYRPF